MPTNDPENPFDAEEKAQLEQSLKATQKLEAAINKARSAGFDVTDRLAELRERRAQLQKIKQVYFPGG